MKPHFCIKCQESSPTQFYIGWKSKCKKCVSELNKETYKGGEKRIRQERANRWRMSNPMHVRLLAAKTRSIKKNIQFDLSLEFLIELWKKQNGLCYYTGLPMDLIQGGGKYDYAKNNNAVSIDRLNSNNGYTKDNVVLCRSCINSAKMDMNVSDFIKMAEEIVAYNKM